MLNHIPALPQHQITPLINYTNCCKPKTTQPSHCHHLNEREHVTVSIKRIWVDYSSNFQSFLICGSQKDFQGRCIPHCTLKPTDAGLFYRSLCTASRQPTDLLQAVGKTLKTLHGVYRGSSDVGEHLHKEQGKKIQNKVYFHYIAWKQLETVTGAIYSEQKD